MDEIQATNTELAVTDDLNNKILTFFIGESIYGIELKHVTEIISIQFITKIPNLPNYIKGIINLRGKIVPVTDTRLKLDFEERAYDEKTCIIVISLDEMQIGLIVDSVNEVMNVNNAKLSSLSDSKASAKDKKYLSSVTKSNGKMILNLDLAAFLNNDLPGEVANVQI